MRGRCNERMMRGEAKRQDDGVTRGQECSATAGNSTSSWHDKRTRGRHNKTTSVLKYIIPLMLLCKLSDSLSFDSEPIQSWRSDDQSTITIFLHLNFSGRIVMQNANPNEVYLLLCFGDTPLMQAFKSNFCLSISSVPIHLVFANRCPSRKSFHFKIFMEKPHFW